MDNNHERLFEHEQALCKLISKLIENFMPLHTLWNLANDWSSDSTLWKDTPYHTITHFIITAIKKLSKLINDLNQQRQLIEKVVLPTTLSKLIDEFKQHVPLITRLRYPGIKTKHWEKIQEVMGF